MHLSCNYVSSIRARNGIFSIRSARSRRRKMRGRGPTAGEAIVRELDFRPVRSRNDELCDCTAHGRQLDHLRGEASASHETAISTGGLSGASKGRIFAWRMQRRRRHSSRSAKTSLLGMAMLNGRDHVQNVARSARWRCAFPSAVHTAERIRLEQRPASKSRRERRWPHKPVPLAIASEKERSMITATSSFRLMRPQRK